MKTFMTLMMIVAALSIQARPGQQNRQRLTIDFHGQVFQGQSTIFLKKEIQKMHPRINFQKWDLKRVVLHAKSARGFGEAYLKVGRNESRIETIDGNRFDFRGPGNYHRVVFPAPGQDQGKWQIHMQGRIKVDRVVVVAQKKAPRRPQVTRTCSVQFETIWGKNIKKFTAQETGPQGTGVQSKACTKAMRKCQKLQNEIPLTKCEVL